MKKTILYRLFKLGSVPKRARPVIEEEGIVVLDEGMPGTMRMKKVRGPGKRYRGRIEGFSGCLVVTRRRILCYTYWKRQISIGTDHPDLSELHVSLLDEQKLSISFESAVFRPDWEGEIEFRFKTDKAREFYEALTQAGCSVAGTASDEP